MTRVFVANTRSEERSALQLLLLGLEMEVAGQAGDWATTLAEAPASGSDMLLVDWDMLPKTPSLALDELRNACPEGLAIVLISRLDARQQAAVSSGADRFISTGETAERVADHLRAVAAGMHQADLPG